jgi:hypothetical protein
MHFSFKNLFLTNAQWEKAEELRDILQKAFETVFRIRFHFFRIRIQR